jgi:hypothetical protein
MRITSIRSYSNGRKSSSKLQRIITTKKKRRERGEEFGEQRDIAAGTE